MKESIFSIRIKLVTGYLATDVDDGLWRLVLSLLWMHALGIYAQLF